MADHINIMHGIKRFPNVSYPVLTPNLTGFQKAVSFYLTCGIEQTNIRSRFYFLAFLPPGLDLQYVTDGQTECCKCSVTSWTAWTYPYYSNVNWKYVEKKHFRHLTGPDGIFLFSKTATLNAVIAVEGGAGGGQTFLVKPQLLPRIPL